MITEIPMVPWQAARFGWLRNNAIPGAYYPILDVGCGAGQSFMAVLADAVHYDGVALKMDCQGLERRQGEGLVACSLTWDDLVPLRSIYPKARFLCQDITEQPLLFEPETFRTIILSEVIEHLSPYYASMVLGQCYHWLMPGGRMLITTPNARPDYRPACVLSADHRCLWTRDLWLTFLNPSEDQEAWRTTTGRAPCARFPIHTVAEDQNFVFVTVDKPEDIAA